MTFGAEIVKAEPANRFALHRAEGDRTALAATDALLEDVASRCIRGQQVLAVEPGRNKTSPDRVEILGLSGEHRAVLEAGYGRDHHEEQGAWYLPESAKLLPGLTQVAWWASEQPRFALNAADAERAMVVLDSVDAILAWAFLQPLMEALHLPVKLRSGYWVGDRRPDQMKRDWAAIDRTYATLGIEATAPLEAFKDGRQWANLDAAQVIEQRDSLLDCWREASPDLGSRAIFWHVDQLLERYYAKAKNGQAERSKVMNKTLERSLSAAFGGDWLALLTYAGEHVHANERITTAVESTAIVIPDRGAARAAAEATGVSAEEIDRILTAYWEGAAETPVDVRVETIRQWWRAFDDLHARQAPGMPSLWGVVSDGHEASQHPNDSDGVFNPGGYSRLGEGICTSVERLWATEVMPRWPDHLVTQPFPHANLASALGPAVSFWHGVGLTCWFLCEGPFSRTDIGGMQSYYHRDIHELEHAGFPIDRQLFADLRQAESRLTERPETDDESTHDLGGGIAVSVSFRVGPAKRDGFEHLRDVVTRYRQAWAERYLEDYLRHRWQSELRRTGDEYHRHTADKGKPPTLKQFAKIAAEAANHWFAGRIDQVCSALQLPAPDPPAYVQYMPADPMAFINRLGKQMGGQRWQDSPEEMPREQRTVMLRRFELAERSLEVVRLWEATQATPTLKGNSWARLTLKTAYGEDIDAGWDWYVQHILAALRLERE